MAQKTPALQQAYGLTVNASNLHILGNGSRFEPLIGNPGDGASPSLSIVDEYHEHDTDALVDTMETGRALASSRSCSSSRRPAIISRDLVTPPCRTRRRCSTASTRTMNLFALIYTVDPKDDWKSDFSEPSRMSIIWPGEVDPIVDTDGKEAYLEFLRWDIVSNIPAANDAASPYIAMGKEYLGSVPGWVWLLVIAAVGFSSTEG
jgi:hypothetical protein